MDLFSVLLNPKKAGLFGGSFVWGGQFDPPFRNTEPQMLWPWNFPGMLFKLLGLRKYKNGYHGYQYFDDVIIYLNTVLQKYGIYVFYFKVHNYVLGYGRTFKLQHK